jgi:hypothetical protein
VKKLITVVSLVLVAACRSTTTTTTTGAPVVNGNLTGAADPASAIRAFMSAVKDQDIQAMGGIWGTANGPARDQMDRAYREKAELIMVCYLKHDRYDIVGDAPNPGGVRAYAVNLALGTLTRSTTFQVVQGAGGRWYVQDVDLKPLQEFCARRG